MKNGVAVVDASVAIKWFFTAADGEPHVEEANLLLHDILSDRLQAVVPALFYSECANVLWKACRIKGYPQEAAIEALRTLNAIDLEVLNDKEFTDNALSLSLGYNHSVYDCLYLAIANQAKADLITADEKFYNTFKKSFPNIRWIGES